MPISDILTYNALNWPSRTALVAGDRHATFAELESSSWRLANAVSQFGEPGDRVAILAHNIPEYVDALYGIPSAGMVLTLLNYRLNPREWAWILGNSGARVLIVERDLLVGLADLLCELTQLEHVVVIGHQAGDPWHSYDELVAAAPDTAPLHVVDDRDIAVIIYTSGTTGFPKGAMISHGALHLAVVHNAMEQEVAPMDRYLMAYPMCHASGFSVPQVHARAGMVVLMHSFDAEHFLAHIEEHRITRTALAPTMASFVLALPDLDRYDLSSVAAIGYGGMPMPLGTAMELARRFKGLFTNFGQTETTFSVTVMTTDDHRRVLAGEEHLLLSCGRPIGGAAVKIFDAEMNELPTGEVGEMCVRSAFSMTGYWANDAATEEAFAGGWLHTGDMARRDEEGFIYIVDRKKDMIVSGGQNIYPSEIERVVAAHPAVAEVSVVGAPDPVWGENVCAFVVRRAGMEVTEAELVATCLASLASYKKPKAVHFVDSLPKNVLGKVLKRELRAGLVVG